MRAAFMLDADAALIESVDSFMVFVALADSGPAN
jgi:hypothetical protein